MTTLARTSSQLCAEISSIITPQGGNPLGYLQAGYRRFLSGQYVVQGDVAPHVWAWSFLRPLAELNIGGAVAATVASGTTGGVITVATPAAGIFDPSMIGQDLTISDTATRTVTVTGFTSPTIVTTSDTAGFASKAISVAASGVVNLPSDFGSLVGRLQYPRSDTLTFPTLQSHSTDEIEVMWRHQVPTEWPYPYAYALAPCPFVTATGQRYQVWLAPLPTTAVTLIYRYVVIPNILADDANYPLGGWQHQDTILYMALADWELKSGHGVGVWEGKAQQALGTSIEIDRRMNETNSPPRMEVRGPRTRAWY